MPRTFAFNAQCAVTSRMSNPEIWSINLSIHVLEVFDSLMETADMGNAFFDAAYQKEILRLRREMMVNRSREEGCDYRFNGLSLRSVAAVMKVAALSGEIKILKMKLIAWIGALIYPWFAGSQHLRPPCKIDNDDRSNQWWYPKLTRMHVWPMIGGQGKRTVSDTGDSNNQRNHQTHEHWGYMQNLPKSRDATKAQLVKQM